MDDDVEGSIGVCSSKKQCPDFDFDKLFDGENDDPPPEIVITKTGGDRAEMVNEELQRYSETELEDKIRRLKFQVANLGPKLPDKGEKLKANLKAHEEERERRKTRPKVAVESKPTDHVESLRPSRINSEVRVGDRAGSQFANLFGQKLETEKVSHTRICDAFENEPRPLGHGDKRKRKQSVRPSDNKERDKKLLAQKERENLKLSSGDGNILNENDLPWSRGRHKLKNVFQGRHSDKAVIDKTVVLLDEDEPKVEERTSDSEEAAMRDIKINYPSSGDPDCVEVQYKDMQCLRPREFLTSPIMNFYIRFLQGTSSSADNALPDYHFFNTYFYKKLQEAVSLKNSDKEASFNKLRRWWRGVNLFEKEYIFLPVHDDLHWSLAIICIHGEEGPTILHLDSLGFHSSDSVFENIKSLLTEEWNILKKEVGPPHVPFSNQIWEHLPGKIDQKIIQVPRQNNDFDCGLFVLYFMERFIQDTRGPEMMKFGRGWFLPSEASGLRSKIKTTLKEEFNKSRGVLDDVILLPYSKLTDESGTPM